MNEVWKVSKSETVLETKKFNVIVDHAEDFLGNKRKMHRIKNHHPGYVMVIPIKIDPKTNQTKFICIKQYRHALSLHHLEFPSGKREYGETGEQSALRELKEETGYDTKSIKFMHRAFVGGSMSSDDVLIYSAIVDGDPGQPEYSERELGSKMEVHEFTADELHQLILKNEMTHMASLASLLVLMLQSEKATQYLAGSDKNPVQEV